ncbi:MAG: LptF/LptG family permease [Thermodesulfobacteriota bacterium]
MSLLYRYIFSQFTRNLAMVISSLITIYLLVDFFEKIDNFIEAGKSATLTAKYLLLKIPLIVDQLLPVCLLLAGVITLGVMNQNREFMALEAGGLSARRILTPILIATFFFTILALLAGEWLVPSTTKETNRIWYEEVKKSKSQGIVRNGKVFFKGKEGIYSFETAAKSEETFASFNYLAWDATTYGLRLQITAKTASCQNGVWSFHNGQLKTIGQDGRYNLQSFAEYKMPLPDQPNDFFIPEYQGEEASISDHLEAVLQNRDPDRTAWQNLHRRLSYIFLGIPLVLLGLPILMTANRRWQHDLSLAIPISCIMAFIAWGWWSTAQAMIHAYNLSPPIASWSVHLLTGSLGFLMINRQSNKPI